MLPIVFLSALSKGYILPIGATLLYLIPVVIAPAYLTGIHPLASVMGIYPHISEAAAAMVESLIDYYNNRRYQHRLFIQTPMQAHVSAMNRAA